MMVPQDFSIPYRSLGLVDIIMPKKEGTDGYRVRAASNFDGVFVDLFTVPFGGGFLDPAVDRGRLSEMPGGQNHVRATFNPSSYGLGGAIDAGIFDSRQFWLQFQPLLDGVPGDASPPILILSPGQRRGGHVAISGTALSQAGIADSMALVIGHQMEECNFVNNDESTSLFLGFEEGGPEVEVSPGSPHTLGGSRGGSATVWVRGGGAAVGFSADFTVRA
jgi:hypothetical protein